jgi:hypothetical protein
MLLRAVLVSAVLFVGVAPAVADTINTPTCRQELAATWAKMEEMLVRLKSVARAGQDEKCQTYRSHAEVVVKAREVFDRCKTGRDRTGDVTHMDGALDDVNSVIDRECSNGSRTAQPQVLAPEPGSGEMMAR